jgi:hypothetical protein
MQHRHIIENRPTPADNRIEAALLTRDERGGRFDQRGVAVLDVADALAD